MTSACASLSGNVESMHDSLVRINTDYLTQIADTLHQMQQEAAGEDVADKFTRAEKQIATVARKPVTLIIDQLTDLFESPATLTQE